jgi:carboxyl-terminal processing protease
LFLKYLDPNKQLFYKKDIDQMTAQLNGMFGKSGMESGNCGPLSDIGKMLVERSVENLKVVEETLGKGYKINEEVRYQTDSKKREYPLDSAQKRSALEGAVHTQIATITAGDVKLSKAKEQLTKRYTLAVKRAKELNPGKMITLFAESFAHALDPHSDYMSPEQLDEFRISMGLSLEGIGVSLSSDDGYTVVQEIIPGGSADRANALKPKDKIIAVAQDTKEAVNIIDMDLSDVVKMIRGKKGTRVKLTVVRTKGAKSETFDVTIVRDKVDMKEQAAKVDYQTRVVDGKAFKIAVIDLPSFYGGSEKNSRDCFDDMKRIVEEAAAKKVDGIVLDLSANGGGLLQDAVRIAGLFIRTGGVVATQDGKGNREVLPDEDEKIAYNGPLMILTTRQSASASEILAGAMKDYHRALIVGGDHTYGKGSVQVLNPLPFKLGAIKFTTQMFYLPGGVSTQFVGVDSDVSMPTYLDLDDLGERYSEYALPPAKTTPFLALDQAQGNGPTEKWTPVSQDLVRYLKDRSSKRVSENQEFKDIQKDLEEVRKNEGWVKVSDILKRSGKDKDKKKERKDLSTTADGRKQLWLKDPRVQESLNIMGDWLAKASK